MTKIALVNEQFLNSHSHFKTVLKRLNIRILNKIFLKMIKTINTS
jgi:hypothetical protein